MDLFRILINRILHKIPLKFLLLVLIFLFLAFFCFNAKKVEANSHLPLTYTSYINNTTYTLNVTSNSDANYWVLFADSNGAPYYLYFAPRNVSNIRVAFNNDGSTTLYPLSDASWICRCNNQGNGNYNTTYQGYTANATIPSGYNILYATNNVINTSDNSVYLSALTINPMYQQRPPYIVNSSDVATWSFDNLIINSGFITGHYSTTIDNVIYQYVRTFKLEMTYQGVVYTIDLRPYMTVDNNDIATFTIPKNELTNHINLYNSNGIMFDLFVEPDDEPNSTGDWSTYSLGTYVLSLTDEEQEQINSDSQKQVLGDINISIQETNESINNLNSNITDLNDSQEETNNKIDNLESSITSSSYNDSDLSNTMHNFGNGFVVTDNTHLEELFTMLYNAFCNNQVVNLTFTIPFVNKPVTISSENISSNYPIQLVTVVHLFVWGTIGLYIIKDIRSMINKMAEGNIENISSDVKKEVL